MNTIFKGIHSEELLKCGCLIKRYVGGKNILEASHKCNQFIKHKTTIWFECGVCQLITSKKQLKIHKNKVHSI